MVHWNPDVVAFSLGFIDVRWYSLCWVLSLFSGYIVVHHLYKRCGVDEDKFEPLFMYCFLGILIGARLGHCLFYEPGFYLSHPMQMILPVRDIPGVGWKFTGYEGLASHGGTLGLMIAVWLYCRKTGIGLWWLLDVMGITAPICAMFIRLGNLMNSEIIGRPTDVPWAFIFERVDMQPRHPGQLYEAIAYLIIFLLGLVAYHVLTNRRKTPLSLGSRFYFGWCIASIFTARILIEYTKEVQEAFEEGMCFNMGQLLSVPFVLGGIYCMYCGMTRHSSNHGNKD